MVNLAKSYAAVLANSEANDEEIQSAEVGLFRLGLPKDATHDDIEQFFDTSSQEDDAKAARDYLAALSQEQLDAAKDLQALGLNVSSSDEVLAAAMLTVKLRPFYGGSNLLAEYLKGSIGSSLKSLEGIAAESEGRARNPRDSLVGRVFL